MREAGRVLMRKQLDRDYRLTRIEFDLDSGYFITPSIPVVIRVYQKDHETDAEYLIISGAVQGTYVSGTTPDTAVHDDSVNHYGMDLTIEVTARELTREVIVDAYPPDEWTG